MNERKLKAKLVEKNFDYGYCAKALGISKNTFTKKINDVEKFSIPQVNILSEILGLSVEEKIEIFLS